MHVLARFLRISENIYIYCLHKNGNIGLSTLHQPDILAATWNRKNSARWFLRLKSVPLKRRTRYREKNQLQLPLLYFNFNIAVWIYIKKISFAVRVHQMIQNLNRKLFQGMFQHNKDTLLCATLDFKPLHVFLQWLYISLPRTTFSTFVSSRPAKRLLK